MVRKQEGFSEVQPLQPDLTAAHDEITGAEHLVFIFPFWLGTLPAIFKGFLERVLQPDLVEPARHGRFVPVLAGKSAGIIVTMGMDLSIVLRRARAQDVQAQYSGFLGCSADPLD